MSITTILAASSAAFLVLSAPAYAQANAADHAAHHPVAEASVPVGAKAEGEVRKVDKEQAKLTLKHGPIASLEMPGMTMVFRVTDPRMLDNLKPGDKVRFTAERVNGAITVTAIETVR